jgi:hypothetical protein
MKFVPLVFPTELFYQSLIFFMRATCPIHFFRFNKCDNIKERFKIMNLSLIFSFLLLFYLLYFVMVYLRTPVTVAERSKVWITFGRSDAVIVVSNPT